MSIYHDQHGTPHEPTAFTQFAAGMFDAYYLRVHQAAQEVEESRELLIRLQSEHYRGQEKSKQWEEKAESEKRNVGLFKRKADNLQKEANAHATEIAKHKKVIEQYAAWRTAVREAINDVPKESLKSGDPLTSVIVRIADLTKAMEEETKSD